MAWYTTHKIRFRGRLLEVETRYGDLQSATVLCGKPLDIVEGSADWERLRKLFGRNQSIQAEIAGFAASLVDV